MRPQRLLLTISAVISVTLWAYACGDGTTDPPPTFPEPATVTVSPGTAQLAAQGGTVQLSAEVRDQNGEVMARATVTWASSDEAVATVSASGLVTGVAVGSATITATAGSASGTATVTVVANPDRVPLAAFYEATDGPNWVNSENWLTDAPLDEWYGIAVDGDGRVSGLRLLDNKLSGRIPPELADLTELTDLSLSVNDFSGEIPPELGSLADLTFLSLRENGLTGEIPPELGNLTALTSLYLQENGLTGEIPPELGNLTELTQLRLTSNHLTSPIPQSFLQLDQLRGFFFGGMSICVPGTSAFVAWLEGVQLDDEAGTFCNATDVAALKLLYDGTDGPGWIESGGWSGDDPVEEWYGVSADSLGHVTELDLQGNGLTGRLPATLGDMLRMTALRIADNELSGRLPISLLRLPLVDFRYSGTELCAPAEASFQAWLNAIASIEGTGVNCAPLSDREILEIVYSTTDGPKWNNNDNWLTSAPLRDWYGVRVNGEGRVSGLSLGGNQLSGPIPPELGNLSELIWVSLQGNRLSGSIPSELGNLADLNVLILSSNSLTGIPPELGNLADLNVLILSYNSLTGPIPPELGNLTGLTNLSLSRSGLTGRIPPELGNLADLSVLILSYNNLTGPIPPELGNLTELTTLDIRRSGLTGRIPPELGKLANLERLILSANDLRGRISPELGNLAELNWLLLDDNNLTGPIPPELGNLAELNWLLLDDNNLTGPIPPELGKLAELRSLFLMSNSLSGSVPPEMGALANIEQLEFAYNPDLAGALPLSLTKLDRLDELVLTGTGLCKPPDAAFQTWLDRLHKYWIAPCAAGEPPAAYLTQAVQSRDFRVPLVAGETALLRVFPTTREATSEGIPLVRARFYLDGRETHVQDIPGKSNRIPTEVYEPSLLTSANTVIAGPVIQPGLEMVIEVDPDSTLDPELGVVKRIPETGRMAVDVKTMPPLDLTLIPFIWTETIDASIVDEVRAMAASPGHHEWLHQTRTILPVSQLTVKAHAPVLSSSNNNRTLFAQTQAIRVMEDGAGHYMGMMPQPLTSFGGFAEQPGWSSFARPAVGTIAHELGHNLALAHAPCRGTGGDRRYPYPGGTIGVSGYDGGGLVAPSSLDLMVDCDPPLADEWISDYHFTNALRYRLLVEGSAGVAAVSASARSLLLWGGVGADSVPYLEPAFVVDAPAALPDSAGEFQITGRTAGGGELFSLSFTMPETADGDGSSSFAFALPVRAGWEGSLATIMLSGPGRSVTLDGESDIPMAILRNPRTGQVRGILRDPPLATEVAADAIGVSAPGLEVLFSRGVPGGGAWRR